MATLVRLGKLYDLESRQKGPLGLEDDTRPLFPREGGCRLAGAPEPWWETQG